MTKTDAPRDITERLLKLLESNEMDFTQTEFMKNKKIRSREQAKERKEIKKMFMAKAALEKNAQSCIANNAVENERLGPEEEEYGSIGHIYVDDPFKQWIRNANAFMDGMF